MPIHYASENGNDAIVQLLVDQGVELNAAISLTYSYNGVYFLFLIESFFFIFSWNSFLLFFNYSPIELACLYDHSSIIPILIENGAKFNPKRKVNSPLLLAIRKEHIGCVQELLKHGADVNHSNGQIYNFCYL